MAYYPFELVFSIAEGSLRFPLRTANQLTARIRNWPEIAIGTALIRKSAEQVPWVDQKELE